MQINFINLSTTIIFTLQVVLINGINGACRTNELTKLNVNNIEKHSDDLLLINLPNTKTKRDRNFVIRKEYVTIVEKYEALRPPNTPINRFFLQYRNGKYIRRPMGANKIGSIPREMVTFLEQNPYCTRVIVSDELQPHFWPIQELISCPLSAMEAGSPMRL